RPATRVRIILNLYGGTVLASPGRLVHLTPVSPARACCRLTGRATSFDFELFSSLDHGRFRERRFHKPLLYPLSYGGPRAAQRAPSGGEGSPGFLLLTRSTRPGRAVTRDALLLCELLANADPSPYELAALQARPSVRAC